MLLDKDLVNLNELKKWVVSFFVDSIRKRHDDTYLVNKTHNQKMKYNLTQELKTSKLVKMDS